MAKLSTEELLEQFKGLTLIELSEFVKAFEETFDVSAAAPVAVAAAPAAAAEAVEEKDEFDVVLESDGDKKIQVIKVARSPAWASARQSPSLRKHPRTCSRARRRMRLKKPRLSSKRLAQASSSSKSHRLPAHAGVR